MQKENYKCLKTALNKIIKNLESINTITIDSQQFKINWMQGGDLKWLAHMNGINAANSHKPCIWCTWNNQERLNLDANWAISDRSHLKSETMLAANSNDKDGYQNIPLMNFITFQKCIVVPLQLCLRITDKIFAKLISHLDVIDGNTSTDLDKRPNLKKLKNFCEEECGVQTAFYFNVKEQNWTLRSINQEERLKILCYLSEKKDLLDLFPIYRNDSKLIVFNFILLEFYSLFKFIKLDHTEHFDKKSFI